jgi:hypothetical protein
MKQSSKLIAQHSALWRGAMKKLLHLFLVIVFLDVGNVSPRRNRRRKSHG